jgi:hypothetical protein
VDTLSAGPFSFCEVDMADETITQASEQETPTATTGTQEAATAPVETQTQDTGTTQATPDTTAAQVQPSYVGGRFKSAEQMEAYILGFEKNQPRFTPQPQTTQTQTQAQTPTLDQLKFSKSHWRNEAFRAQAAGDESAYQKASANMDWCDDQIGDARLAQESKKWQGQGAAESLIREGQELLKPYQANLVPGDPLYETAMTYFNQAKQAIEGGASIDQILGGLTVLAAAQKTGKTTAGVKQTATAQFADALNKAAKTAIVTGGGAATKMTGSGKLTSAQIEAMSDEEFAKYDAQIMEQSKSVPWNRYQRF